MIKELRDLSVYRKAGFEPTLSFSLKGKKLDVEGTVGDAHVKGTVSLREGQNFICVQDGKISCGSKPEGVVVARIRLTLKGNMFGWVAGKLQRREENGNKGQSSEKNKG